MIIDSVIERKIFDTIFKLKEIKREAKDIERLSKGKRHLSLVIQDTPHLPDQGYYWVRACEYNGFSDATYFHFYVYPDSMRIMYYDPASDSILTLKKWRKTNGM